MKKLIWPALLAAALMSMGMSAQAQDSKPAIIPSLESGSYTFVAETKHGKRGTACIEIQADNYWRSHSWDWEKKFIYIGGPWFEDDRYVYLYGLTPYYPDGQPDALRMENYVIDRKKKKGDAGELYFNGMGSISAILHEADPQEWFSHDVGQMLIYRNESAHCF